MGKPHPMALRERIVAFVDEGHGHREATRHFRVSPRFVNELMKLRLETGSFAPRRQGHAPGGWGKLAPHAAFVRERMAEAGELALDELCVELGSAWRGRAPLQCRPPAAPSRAQPQKNAAGQRAGARDIREARELWTTRRKRFFAKALPRLIFVDETSTNTRLTKLAGRRKASATGRMLRSANRIRRPSLPACAATAWSRRGSSTRR